MTDHTQAEPRVSLTGYSDNGGEMTSNIYKLTVNGVQYTLDRWATRNACGAEWITEDGKSVDAPFDDTKLDAMLAAFDSAFYERWAAHVAPVIERITAEALEAANQIKET